MKFGKEIWANTWKAKEEWSLGFKKTPNVITAIYFFLQCVFELCKYKDECSALNRNNFHTASIVATAIARWEDTSFENFYIDNSPSAMKLQSLVHFILEKRRFLTPIRVGELEEGRCGPKEIAQYDEIMKKYCENDSSDPVTTNMVPSLPFQVSVPFPSKPWLSWVLSLKMMPLTAKINSIFQGTIWYEERLSIPQKLISSNMVPVIHWK